MVIATIVVCGVVGLLVISGIGLYFKILYTMEQISNRYQFVE